MRRRLKVSYEALAALVILAAPLSAQWIHYPSEGVPRKPDGSVNMTAPAPRLPDGKPDFSGIWMPGDYGRPAPAKPAAGAPNAAANPNPAPPKPVQDLPGDQNNIRSGRQMSNLGVDLEGGKLPYQAWQLPIVKERTENRAIDDPHIRCFPDNFIRAYSMPHLLKFINTPGLFVTLNELNAGYRQVFIDGRPLPVDPVPSLMGYSTAKWVGDTLVIDTNGVRDDTWIDWNGSVLTEAAKVREEIRRPDFGHIEIKVSVDDPKAYTKPWTVNLKMRIVLDTELVDEMCIENEQSLQHLKPELSRK